MILANPFGVILAFAVNLYYAYLGYFPTDVPNGDPKAIEGTQNIIICNTVINTIIVLFFVVVYRDKPKNPPSKVAMITSDHFAGASLWKETSNLIRMKNFMLLCFCFAIIYSS